MPIPRSKGRLLGGLRKSDKNSRYAQGKTLKIPVQSHCLKHTATAASDYSCTCWQTQQRTLLLVIFHTKVAASRKQIKAEAPTAYWVAGWEFCNALFPKALHRIPGHVRIYLPATLQLPSSSLGGPWAHSQRLSLLVTFRMAANAWRQQADQAPEWGHLRRRQIVDTNRQQFENKAFLEKNSTSTHRGTDWGTPGPEKAWRIL